MVQDLTRAHDEAKLLFENAPQGVATLDQSGVIVAANRALGELVGTPADLLPGRRLDDFSVEPRLIDEVWWGLSESGTIVHIDRTFTTAGGRRRNVALSFRVLSTGDDAHRSLLVNAVDVTERQRLQDLVTRMAEHDSLTGLANRRRLEAEVKRIVAAGEHGAGDGALMMIDLDNFKQVNDALGHHVGDQLLVEFGRLLTEQVRAEDLVGRLGGDEFVIVLPTATRGAAEGVSRRIAEAVDERFGGRSDETGRIRASIGFSMFTDARDQGIDPFRLADRLMYDAKRAGRSRTAGSTTADGLVRAGAPGTSVADVRAVLESDAMRIDLQPMLDLRTGRIDLAEGLLRLTCGAPPLSTGEFVGVAEQAGLCPDLDVRVLRMGLDVLERLQDHRPDFRLSLNVSAQSLGSAEARALFAEELENRPFPQGSLILEVTETAPLIELDPARKFQQVMSDLGAVFAIDDFGTGNAPFRYLSRLDFQYLKIAGEFVEGMICSETDARIVRAVSRLGRDQGMLTIAEHVSSAAILERVRDCGITYAQGFHIGAAVPMDAFISTHLESEVPQSDQVMEKNV
ncbi:putative bifunctional diguanylate cyclase/phosphodiesterase [Brevibacterium senegalense]|uniref:putative bifunctional diguanylate cyclase/phosphodiesterase n=1 Tax=Brevibacterium senegalense TaxID=1033736 RepID=UPI000317CBAE|nr:EAL domain-containing protein [Brevibacterium senegalense]